MKLTGVHLLLTYRCTFECDHCFVWSSPRADGTITLEMMTKVLDQAKDLGTVDNVYFEGGEPFLFHPLLVEGIRRAKERGFSTGVVTNCYWATAVPDAELWLQPLRELEVGDLSVSSDEFHAGEDEDPRPAHAVEAAKALGLDEAVITIDPPAVCTTPDEKGLPIVGGSVRFRGRAAVNLTEGLPLRPWTDFDECPDEDFLDPGRVHIDGWGNVHLCQGVLLGNINDRSLGEMLEKQYEDFVEDVWIASTHAYLLIFTRNGVSLPWLFPTDTFWQWGAFIALGVIAGVYMYRRRDKLREQTGQNTHAPRYALGAFLAVALVGWFAHPIAGALGWLWQLLGSIVSVIPVIALQILFAAVAIFLAVRWIRGFLDSLRSATGAAGLRGQVVRHVEDDRGRAMGIRLDFADEADEKRFGAFARDDGVVLRYAYMTTVDNEGTLLG